MTSKLDEIKSKLSSIEFELKEADDKIEKLRGKKLKNENPVLVKDENDTLELTHEVNTQDIKLYKEKNIQIRKRA